MRRGVAITATPRFRLSTPHFQLVDQAGYGVRSVKFFCSAGRNPQWQAGSVGTGVAVAVGVGVGVGGRLWAKNSSVDVLALMRNVVRFELGP